MGSSDSRDSQNSSMTSSDKLIRANSELELRFKTIQNKNVTKAAIKTAIPVVLINTESGNSPEVKQARLSSWDRSKGAVKGSWLKSTEYEAAIIPDRALV